MTAEPMTTEQLAAMRARVDAHDGPDHYTYTIDGITYDGHWAHDIRRVLAEVDRMRAENARLAARVDQIEHGLQGKCPSCRHESLTVNDRGWLTCHWSTCEHPDAAALLLIDPPTDTESETSR